MQNYTFEDAHHALIWATEVLRARRFPKIAAFYQEAWSGEYGPAVKQWCGSRGDLPTEEEERLALALDVYRLLGEAVETQQQRLVVLYYWGDFADEATYRQAQAFQEKMRRQGTRVRLSYRYSFRQLGHVLGMAHKTAAKRLRQAQQALQQALELEGFVHSNQPQAA
jgi:hypothetical protein